MRPSKASGDKRVGYEVPAECVEQGRSVHGLIGPSDPRAATRDRRHAFALITSGVSSIVTAIIGSAPGWSVPWRTQHEGTDQAHQWLAYTVAETVALVAEYHAIGRDLLQPEIGRRIVAFPQQTAVDADQTVRGFG